MITIVHPFYDQHKMIPLHLAAWRDHTFPASYVLVDDGSPHALPKYDFPRLTIARVDVDIPWNVSCARNLGVHLARTDWVLCADVDHVVNNAALESLRSLDLESEDCFFTFSRRTLTGEVGVQAAMNFLMRRDTFFRIGGYDEDFAGNYGKEETFFFRCVKHLGLKRVHLPDVELTWHPATGSTPLFRDRVPNERLFHSKLSLLSSGQYQNGARLRTPWSLVQGS